MPHVMEDYILHNKIPTPPPPPLPPRNGLQPVAVEYAPSTTNFSLERKPLVSLQNEVQETSAENPY